MKVILKKNIESLGLMGDIKTVRDGYARNYLLPKGLVELATEGALKNWKLGEERRKKRFAKELEKAKQSAEKMNEVTLSFTRKVTKTEDEEDKIFGSVSKTDILKSLKASGFEITKDNINLEHPIKTIGETKVTVFLETTRQAKALVTVKIVPKKA
ncbi:MAG TPA: 50S ribosomal protein L9 [Elusimicrobiales bacterium]|nr:50S ribosomal protein L9 [Elusimicrobiales bacterium]